jgi:hypothetical protein
VINDEEHVKKDKILKPYSEYLASGMSVLLMGSKDLRLQLICEETCIHFE